MNGDEVRGSRSRGIFRVAVTIVTALLLPPFLLLAVAPMMLLLAPVALIGIPFIVPALISVSIAAHSEEKQRASWRPPLARGLRVVN